MGRLAVSMVKAALVLPLRPLAAVSRPSWGLKMLGGLNLKSTGLDLAVFSNRSSVTRIRNFGWAKAEVKVGMELDKDELELSGLNTVEADAAEAIMVSKCHDFSSQSITQNGFLSPLPSSENYV